VLSAVDAETAEYMFENALKGPLMQGRTVVLVSHHVQLCVPGADYIVRVFGLLPFSSLTIKRLGCLE
jgi:ABC-type nitrate/sulfonate/bicarbonate transport system ATPase subunit